MSDSAKPTPQLPREEYIEQVYFFRSYRERLNENQPSQEILGSVREEILATTRLPMAIDFLRGEILLTGRISEAMQRLSHYFTAFQSFVMHCAEEDKARVDTRTALQILEREAQYRVDGSTPAGMFVYQFESIARNRLGYDRGMRAMALDPIFDDQWSTWIRQTQRQLGTRDLADLIFRNSHHFRVSQERRGLSLPEDFYPLFEEQEGRIARANHGKDPLYMFAALQRQLGYPRVPRPARKPSEPVFHPALEQRLHRIEQQLKLLEGDVRGSLDLSEFYKEPPRFDDDGFVPPN